MPTEQKGSIDCRCFQNIPLESQLKQDLSEKGLSGSSAGSPYCGIRKEHWIAAIQTVVSDKINFEEGRKQKSNQVKNLAKNERNATSQLLYRLPIFEPPEWALEANYTSKKNKFE